MSTNYKLTVDVDSTITGDVCIFQEAPNTNVSRVLTLAWLSKRAHPGTKVEFDWTIDYNFNWGRVGDFEDRAQFKSSQVVPADLKVSNQISFDYQDGAYNFYDQKQNAATEDNLYIQQGGNVQSNQAYVGIGMSGAGSFVVPSQPNMKIIFKPKPTYYLVFGDFTQGQLVDITELTSVYKVVFNGTTERSVTLTGNNTWK